MLSDDFLNLFFKIKMKKKGNSLSVSTVCALTSIRVAGQILQDIRKGQSQA